MVNLHNYCSDDIYINKDLHTIPNVLNTSMKVSGGARHYLPRKASLKLCYARLVMLCYIILCYG